MNVFKGVTKNRLFMGIISFTVILQVRTFPSLFFSISQMHALILWSYKYTNHQVIIIMFLGKFTTTVRLSWQLWLVSIAIGFVRSVVYSKVTPENKSYISLPLMI